jgi:hypothetical protein
MAFRINGKIIRPFSDTDFKCKGGEANLYIRGGIAYKICHTPSIMIPEAKVKELQALDSPLIVKPIDYIFDESILIGFTMKALDASCVPLVKLFTNSFRDAHAITNDHIIALCQNIKDETHDIHSKNILIVDGNELNYMVDDDFVTPYFIDVNSWKTPNFPATAIMPSIKDFATKGFSVYTDWFSFAVVSFQLFIGMHPFGGIADGFKKKDLAGRIKANVSILNPKVIVPDAARDFSLIPAAYMDWYFKLFEKGERILPPALPGDAGIISVQVILVQSTNNFEIQEIKEYPDDVVYYGNFFGRKITKTKKKLYVNKAGFNINPGVEIMYVMPEMVPLFIKIHENHINFFTPDVPLTVKDVNIKCSNMMIINNILYLKNRGKIVEMHFEMFGATVVPTPKKVWKCEEQSSEMFSGVIAQSLLGDAFLVIPHDGKCKNVKVPELDDYRVIDAKYDNGICVIIGHKDNQYDKLIFKFDAGVKYNLRIIEDVDYLPINFVTLDNGVCIMINEDDSVEIFLNRLDKNDVKRIEDPEIHSTMKLTKDGIVAMFMKGNKVFSIKTKK